MAELSPPTERTYRPEIDGLRALAVVAVIINHFNKNILPSGYLGVDIFFVISGFVITSSLAGRSGKNFGDFLLSFYTRRIKRLVPALVLFVLITSFLICLVNPAPKDILQTGIASLFGLSNLYLLEQSRNYFSASTEMDVFTHTWSLGVEEQFYFLFPFLVWLTGFGRKTTNGSRSLFWTVTPLTVASWVIFNSLSGTNLSASYFLMPARFWELGAGCLLFLLLEWRTLKELSKCIPPLPVLGLLIAVLFTSDDSRVKVTTAVVLLTGLLIASLRAKTATYKLLTQKQVVYIGLISYSLYLWHWGVLSLSRWTIGIHWWSVPFQVALMFLLSIVSYRFVETPLRHSNWSTLRWQSIGCGVAASTITALALAGLSMPPKGFLYLGDYRSGIGGHRTHANAQDGKKSHIAAFTGEACGDSSLITQETLSRCNLSPVLPSRLRVVAMGDSQTYHLYPLLSELRKNTGVGISAYSTGGYPFPGVRYSFELDAPKARIEDYSRRFSDFWRVVDSELSAGDIVILSSLLNWYSSTTLFEEWVGKVEVLASNVERKGVSIVIFSPLPVLSGPNPPIPLEACSPQWFRPFGYHPGCPQNLTVDRNAAYTSSLRSIDALRRLATKHKNIFVYDPFPAICPPWKSTCNASEKGRLLFTDAYHLSRDGALLLYPDFLSFLHRNKLLKQLAT